MGFYFFYTCNHDLTNLEYKREAVAVGNREVRSAEGGAPPKWAPPSGGGLLEAVGLGARVGAGRTTAVLVVDPRRAGAARRPWAVVGGAEFVALGHLSTRGAVLPVAVALRPAQPVDGAEHGGAAVGTGTELLGAGVEAAPHGRRVVRRVVQVNFLALRSDEDRTDHVAAPLGAGVAPRNDAIGVLDTRLGGHARHALGAAAVDVSLVLVLEAVGACRGLAGAVLAGTTGLAATVGVEIAGENQIGRGHEVRGARQVGGRREVRRGGGQVGEGRVREPRHVPRDGEVRGRNGEVAGGARQVGGRREVRRGGLVDRTVATGEVRPRQVSAAVEPREISAAVLRCHRSGHRDDDVGAPFGDLEGCVPLADDVAVATHDQVDLRLCTDRRVAMGEDEVHIPFRIPVDAGVEGGLDRHPIDREGRRDGVPTITDDLVELHVDTDRALGARAHVGAAPREEGGDHQGEEGLAHGSPPPRVGGGKEVEVEVNGPQVRAGLGIGGFPRSSDADADADRDERGGAHGRPEPPLLVEGRAGRRGGHGLGRRNERDSRGGRGRGGGRQVEVRLAAGVGGGGSRGRDATVSPRRGGGSQGGRSGLGAGNGGGGEGLRREPLLEDRDTLPHLLLVLRLRVGVGGVELHRLLPVAQPIVAARDVVIELDALGLQELRALELLEGAGVVLGLVLLFAGLETDLREGEVGTLDLGDRGRLLGRGRGGVEDEKREDEGGDADDLLVHGNLLRLRAGNGDKPWDNLSPLARRKIGN